jgi:protein-tyrosine phosphatase
MSQIKVLFVCMGNICRSPTAEGVFNKLLQDKQLTDRFLIDSAGTHDYHIGKSPDGRAQQTAKQRGIDLSALQGRQVNNDDFDYFDHILAMDTDNAEILRNACPNELQHKIKLFLDFAPEQDERNVPDPYYGGQNGFEHVFDLVEAASKGFLDSVL